MVLLGTGGWPDEGNTYSDYLFKFYFAESLSTGLRINQPNSRLAYELTPITICFGNGQFLLEYVKIGIDVKLLKKEKQLTITRTIKVSCLSHFLLLLLHPRQIPLTRKISDI